MSRGGWAIRLLQDLVPTWLTPVVEALTAVGDPVLLLVIAPALYWTGERFDLFTDRDDAARLLAVTLGALALVVLLKEGFALPRPTPELNRIPTDGYGFPSGHAIGSTAVYGALAVLIDRGRRDLRLAAAGGIVAVVALTRVVLGVHYLVDVVVGAAVGAAFLAVALRLTRRDVGYGFWLAGAIAVAGLVLGEQSVDAATALGGSLGAAVAWTGLDWDRIAIVSPSGPLLAIGTIVLGGVVLAVEFGEPPLGVVAVVTGLVGAAVVGLPAVEHRWARA